MPGSPTHNLSPRSPTQSYRSTPESVHSGKNQNKTTSKQKKLGKIFALINACGRSVFGVKCQLCC